MIQYITVVDMFSGHAVLYPYKESTAKHDVVSIHDCMSRYGRFDEIRTDPGTDFKSESLEQLNRWYGIMHVFRLVGRRAFRQQKQQSLHKIYCLCCITAHFQSLDEIHKPNLSTSLISWL